MGNDVTGFVSLLRLEDICPNWRQFQPLPEPVYLAIAFLCSLDIYWRPAKEKSLVLFRALVYLYFRQHVGNDKFADSVGEAHVMSTVLSVLRWMLQRWLNQV